MVSECACEGEAWEPAEIQDIPDEKDAGDYLKKIALN